VILLTPSYIPRESCSFALEPQGVSAQHYFLAMELMVMASSHNEIPQSTDCSHDSLLRRFYFFYRAMKAGEPTSKDSETLSVCDIAPLPV
jgi:hypothetical protein